MTDPTPSPAAAISAVSAVAAVKDLGGFVVLVVLTGWVVWKGVPALVAFLGSQERAMNAIVVKLTEIDAKIHADGASTRAHVTDEVTDGARHPLKDAIDAVARESIVRDGATLARIETAENKILAAIRDEARDTRTAVDRISTRPAH